MGVYLCLGQAIYETNRSEAIEYEKFGNFTAIQEYVLEHDKVLVFLGKGIHKIKKKAEQIACEDVIMRFNSKK